MGRVIPYIDIETNRLPGQLTFETAVSTFCDVTDEAIAEGTVEGAFIFGSVAIGQANARSDFDAFIMLPEAHIETYQAAQKISMIVAAESLWLIPISPIVQTSDALKEGRHEMDRFFCAHLTSEYRLVEGQDPAKVIKINPDPAHEILAEYITHKKRRISNDYMSTSPEEVRDGLSLQRTLDLPAAIGRKLLQAAADVGLTENAVIKTADKKCVTETTLALLERHGLEEGYDDLLAMQMIYESIFSDAVNEAIDQRAYEQVLRELHEQIPHALVWLDQLETHLLPLIKTANACDF